MFAALSGCCLHGCSALQGYRQKDYFIATQGPLSHTVEDFWRMVWEWRCHSIVMLTELKEREQVRYSTPWCSCKKNLLKSGTVLLLFYGFSIRRMLAF